MVKSDYGMSIRDVMDTDWRDLMAVLGTREPEQEVMSLEDFVRGL